MGKQWDTNTIRAIKAANSTGMTNRNLKERAETIIYRGAVNQGGQACRRRALIPATHRVIGKCNPTLASLGGTRKAA